MNKIILIGNLATKPEVKQAKNGSSVCVFNLAVNNGEATSYYRINAWGKLGENCEKYLDKGSKIGVSGRLNPRLYEANGKAFMNLDVTVDEVEFLTAKKKEKEEDFTDINPNDLPF